MSKMGKFLVLAEYNCGLCDDMHTSVLPTHYPSKEEAIKMLSTNMAEIEADSGPPRNNGMIHVVEIVHSFTMGKGIVIQ